MGGKSASSYSSDDCHNERCRNRDLVTPIFELLSDSEDDGVSPSQHKLAMKKQFAGHDVVPTSTSGSDGEEEEVEEEDVEQPIDGQSGTSFESTSTAQFFRGLPR